MSAIGRSRSADGRRARASHATLDRIRDGIAAELACKAAIKVNMPLTAEKMQWLIDELMKTQNPMTCPHGRPIMMRMGLRDIERGFKRPV
jgi:DNA mismatch repair protein MutL